MSDLASLYIKVDSTGVVTASKDLNRLTDNSKQAETATASMERRFRSLTGVLTTLATGYAALKLAQYIKDATMLAARYEMMGNTMRVAGNNAGYTAAQMEAAAQGMQKVGISMLASRDNAMKLAIAHVDIAKAADLARVAQDVARVANINSSEAFTRMIHGMRSGEVEIFKTLGLTISLEGAYRSFEKANNLAKGTITATQRPQAIMNELLKEGSKYAGLYEATLKTASGQMLSMQRHTENLKVSFGLLFTPALTEIVRGLTGAVKGLNGELSGQGKEDLMKWGDNIRAALLSAAGAMQAAAASLLQMYSVYLKIRVVFDRANYAFADTDSPKRKAIDEMAAEARAAEGAAAGLIEKAAKNFDASAKGFAAERESAQKVVDAAEKAYMKEHSGKTPGQVELSEKAIAAAQKLRDEWMKTAEVLNFELKTAGLDEFGKKMAEIARDMAALRKNPNANLKLIDEIELSRETKLIDEWYKDYLERQVKATVAAQEQADKTTQHIIEGQKKIDEAIKHRKEIDEAAPQKAADEAAKMVTFYKEMLGMEDQYRAAQLDWIEKKAKAEIAAGKDAVAWKKWEEDQKTKLHQASMVREMDDRSAAFSSMADNFSKMGQLYAEDSSERQALSSLSKAATLAEMGALVQKNIMIATGAIANQGNGDPYTAFGRIAAMAAVMSGVLGMGGIAFGGGGTSAPAPSAAYGIGTTTLGGANDSGSQSIANTSKLLEDTYDLQKTTLTGIYDNMKQLNANITGIVKQVVLGGIGNTTEGQLSAGFASARERLPLIGGAVKVYDDYMKSIPLIGGAIGKVVDWFWGGSGGSKSLLASGINVQGGDVSPYSVVHTAGVNKSWGFGGKDPYDTRTQGASDSALTAFFYGPNGVSATMSAMFYDVANGLGADADKAKQIITDAFLNMGDINLMGADTPEKIQKAIMESISKVEDIAARSIFGEEFINKYIKTNEAAAETVFRLYIDLESVTKILALTGKSATQNTIDLSESLITLAGGLDKLQEAATSYYDNFTSDSQKQIDRQKSLTSAMAQFGEIIPSTRAAFVELVKAQDITIESQRELYWALISGQDAFDEYYNTLGDTVNKTDELTESLKSLSRTISDWLAELNLSDLAPTQSAAAWNNQYQTKRAAASAEDASAETVADYLAFATKYLGFQKSYGTAGSYLAVYDAVVASVTGIQATTAARLPSHATGLDYVPRDNYLANLHRGERVLTANEARGYSSDTNGGEVTVHSHIYLDGREIQTSVAKGMQTNRDLIDSTRKAVKN